MRSEPELCSRLSEIVADAIRTSPLWRSMPGQSPPPYHSFREFRARVPAVDKQLLFHRGRGHLADGLSGGSMKAIRDVIPSSGTSGGTLGLSMLGDGDLARVAGLMDRFLEARFRVSAESTLVLSALPGGVRVPTTAALSLYAGTRPDIAHELLQSLGEQHAQILIVAEPLYAKRLLEYLFERGYPLRSKRIHLVLGGYYLPENLRDYLSWLLGVRIDRRRGDRTGILSTYGVGEVGLHLLYETAESVALRRFLRDRPRLVARLCGEDLPTAPMIFSYEPDRVFAESVDGRLVFTMLEEDRLQPVIRYDTGDRGGFIASHELREHLPAELLDLVPDDGSDLIWMYGRQGAHFMPTALVDTPRTLEALFLDARRLWVKGEGPSRGQALKGEDSPSRLLASITGHFSLRGHGPGRRSHRNSMKVRLAPERSGRAGWERFREAQEIAPLPADLVRRRLLSNLDVLFGRLPADATGQPGPSAVRASVSVKLQGYWEHSPGSLGQVYEAKPRFVQPGPTFRLAVSERDTSRIFRLRHYVFVTEEGLDYTQLGAKAGARIIRDPADNGAAHFMAEVGGKLVGSLRVVTDYGQFEDKEDFDFAGWTYEPASAEDPEIVLDAARDEAKYGVLFRRDGVALVGRICVARAYRGAQFGIAEGLIQMGLHHLLTRNKAAVFLDCSDAHVQRYQAAGFVEYKPPYVHRTNGREYHTLLAVVDQMEYRRAEMVERTRAVWPQAWRHVLGGLMKRPPTFVNPLDLLLWADLLGQASQLRETQPLVAERPRYQALSRLKVGLGDKLLSALRAEINDVLAALPMDDSAREILRGLGAARLAGASGDPRESRLISLLVPLLYGAASSPDPHRWLATLQEDDLAPRLRERVGPVRTIMTLRPGKLPEGEHAAARFSFVYDQLNDVALQLLWEGRGREHAIALKGWFEYRRMVARAGSELVRSRLPAREEARLAIRARVHGSVRAPIVGSPFLRKAAAMADDAAPLEPTHLTARDDWAIITEPHSNLGDAGPLEGEAAWVHERYSSLEGAFRIPEAAPPDTYVTDPQTVVYLTRGVIELLPLDGGDEPLMVIKEGHVISALAALTDSTVRFRARARGPIVLGEIDRGRFLRELERDSYLSLTLARQLVLAHRTWRARAGAAPSCELECRRGGRLAARSLPAASFRALAEGLEPHWRVSGSSLFERGAHADSVYLVEMGRLLYARDVVSLPLLTESEAMDAELAALEEKLRADGVLLPATGNIQRLAGFWDALLPLDDPMVSGSRGRGRPGAAGGRGVSGAVEGELRRGPQPERHDVTGVVGPENAIIYELPREEFIRRLEAQPRLARDVCQQVAVGVALLEGRVVEGRRALPPEEEAIAQLLRNTRQLSRPPSPIAIA